MERSHSNVIQWLSSFTSWVMVFDNADILDYDTISSYCPSGIQGNIIITSRNPNLARIASPEGYWEITELDMSDATRLLEKAAGLKASPEPSQNLINIANELHCIPLALDQAGALIRCGKCTVMDFLDVYKTHRNKLLRDKSFKGASNYGVPVYTTWDLSYEEVRRRAAEENPCGADLALLLIDLFAMFHYTDIREEMFSRSAESMAESIGVDASGHIFLRPPCLGTLLELNGSGEWDRLSFREAISVLSSLSLVTANECENTISYAIYVEF